MYSFSWFRCCCWGRPRRVPRHSNGVCPYDLYAGRSSRWPSCGRTGSTTAFFSYPYFVDWILLDQGGYNLDSITNSALAVTEIILGGAPGEMKSMVVSEAAAETVWLVAREQSKYWRSVSPKACEPQEGVSVPLLHIMIAQLLL